MVRLLVEALTPGRPYRSEPRLHPYTLDGRQGDVCWDGEWVEVWECGLAPWRPVSAMPPVRRDLSVAVQADDTVEDLGDRVRDALGPDQKNVLVRAVLRHLERTLTE
jgi:phenylalanyl-tRNA synthetase beta subunit